MIAKGILLWNTFVSIILFLGGIDGLNEQGMLIPALLWCTFLSLLCYKYIDKDEFNVLSLSNFINKLLK